MKRQAQSPRTGSEQGHRLILACIALAAALGGIVNFLSPPHQEPEVLSATASPAVEEPAPPSPGTQHSELASVEKYRKTPAVASK